MLPLHLQMEIDIHAQLHAREVAEGFAKARARIPLGAAQQYALLLQALASSSAAQLGRIGDPYMLRTADGDYWFGANAAPGLGLGLGLW